MMIGTRERERSSRHTSMPDTLGSITSSRTMSGWVASKRARASAPSRAAWTRNPSRLSPTVKASTNDSSSSTTITVAASATRSFPFTRGLPADRAHACCRRDSKREYGSLAFPRYHAHPSLVIVGHVPDDCQAESGTTSVACAGPVDPVKALEDAVEVAGGNADAVVNHVKLHPLGVAPHGDLHLRAAVRVLHGVLEEVVD